MNTAINVKTKPKVPKEKQARKKENPSSGSGLSITVDLTATYKIVFRENGEGQALTFDPITRKTTKPKDEEYKKGRMIKKGLSRNGKRTIRIVSDCYELLITDEHFRNKHEPFDRFDMLCRFITLTFRVIIPDDPESKRLLDSFLKRLRRQWGFSGHYLWVAERQKRGAIHFHILTPERIVEPIPGERIKEYRLRANTWVNRAWNETVANWALKKKKISKEQHAQWLSEYSLSENYYRAKIKFQLGERTTEPRKPDKSEYLLLPNIIHVLNPGKYMAKYMSKEGQNIVGGMYDASTISRDFLKKNDRIEINCGSVYMGNRISRFIEKRAAQDGVKTYTYEVPFNEMRVVWCKDGYKLMQYYFEYIEIYGTPDNQIKDKIIKIEMPEPKMAS